MTDDKNDTNGDLTTAESANSRVWYFAYGASMNPKSFEALHISPTRRYLDLVKAAAQAHHLDPTYQAWLSSIPGYDGPSTLRERLGKILFLLVFLPPLTVPILLSYFWRPEQSPRFISAFLDRLRHPIWWCYERFFRPAFGPGAGEKPNNSSV